MQQLNNPKDKSKIEIKSPKILAVEGQDEWWFFCRILEKYLNIKDVQVIDIEGESKFKEKLELLRLSPNFSIVSQIGFVRDADEDSNISFEKIQNAIKDNLKISPPVNINSWISDTNYALGVFVLPNSSDSGMLEDLCMESVAEDPIMPCIDAYFECMKKVLSIENLPKNFSKSKTQVFLASRKEYKTSIGFGAEKGYWNFSAPCMQALIKFLKGFEL